MHTRRSHINLKRAGRSLVLLSLFSLMIWGNFTGCEPEDWTFGVNCNECNGFEPDSADLIVYLTIDQQNDSVPLTFYKGSYEQGVVDWQDTATTEEFLLISELNVEYTVMATYRSGARTIIAFDSDKMHIYNGEAECGSPCFIVKGGIFDLRLKE